MVSVRTAARMLDLSSRSVYRRISDGTIPAVRIGGALRISLATITKLGNAA